MNFFDAIRICFLEFAVFEGRSRRSEYWWFQLFVILMTGVAFIIDTSLLGYNFEATFTPAMVILDAVTFLPLAAVTARRFHDVGLSGWFQLPIFTPYLYYLSDIYPPEFEGVMTVLMALTGIYSLWMLFKFIQDSNPGTNDYGPNPKEPDMGTVFD